MKTLATFIVILALAALPATVMAKVPPAVSSSAQEISDRTGDATEGADIIAFSLSQDRALIHYGWTFAKGADTSSQQLQVCAVSARQTMCLHDATHVRVASRILPARIRFTGQSIKVSVSARRLGYSASKARTVTARAKTSFMLSYCPIACTDVSPRATSSISL